MISNRVRDTSLRLLQLAEETGAVPEDAINDLRGALPPDEVQVIGSLVRSLQEHREQLDRRLLPLLRRMDWEALPPAERAMLRLLAWEFWICPDQWEQCAVAAVLDWVKAVRPSKPAAVMAAILARHFAREIAFRILYAVDVDNSQQPQQLLDYFAGVHGLDTRGAEFAAALVTGVLEHLPEIDRSIIPFLRRWRLERLATVDRVLLRLAAFEITTHRQTPPRVFINEAVELAKHYGGDDSPAFINAVLDRFVARITGSHPNAEAPSKA